MKRILVHIPMTSHGEYDIFSAPDSGKLLEVVNKQYQGSCPNFGNRLWFQGIISEISTPENELFYFSPDMTKDYINSHFDLVLAPMANVFSMVYQSLLERLAERFRGIQIPVYVIACGIQADSYDQLHELCRVLKPAASAFMSSVYDTGGEFALRGYFTKEFFDKLGFSSAVVTGCPSMFQLGRDLHISDEKVAREDFRPLLNGKPQHYKDLFQLYPNAEFFDQNSYYHELWDSEYCGEEHFLRRFIRAHGFDTASWLLSDRIKLIPDMNIWRQYLIHGGFSMSYGSRIHGSIMPILAGIPAVLECRDARTREMAEFFSIPFVAPGAHREQGSLYARYQEADYKEFNQQFSQRFAAYEAFLQKCGIVSQINEQNCFFHDMDRLDEQSATLVQRAELQEELNRNHVLWKCFDTLLTIKRKIASA